jgi:hypothetical protein
MALLYMYMYEMTRMDAIDCLLHGRAHKSCTYPYLSRKVTVQGTAAQPRGRRIVQIIDVDQLRCGRKKLEPWCAVCVYGAIVQVFPGSARSVPLRGHIHTSHVAANSTNSSTRA